MPSLTNEAVQKKLAPHGLSLVSPYEGSVESRVDIACTACSAVFKRFLKNAMNGRVRCPTCSQDKSAKDRVSKLHSDLKEKGFTLTSDWDGIGAKKSRVIVECLDCKKRKEISVSEAGLTKRPIICRGCKVSFRDVNIDLCSELSEGKGFKLLSKSVDKVISLECVRCKSPRTIHLTNLLRNGEEISCSVCKSNDWLSVKRYELKCQGYNLLEKPQRSSQKCLMECMSCSSTFMGNIYDYSATRGLSGKCPHCPDIRIRGFRCDIPGIFYYLRVSTNFGPLYKIGVTNRTVGDRYRSSDLENIHVISEIKFEQGSKAADLERYYLRIFSDFKYNGEPVLHSKGDTELFTKDVLCLDSNYNVMKE